MREGVKYRMLHSAAEQNSHAGGQIWLDRSLSGEIRACAAVSERLVWTACPFPGGQYAVFVAAHSPTETSIKCSKKFVLGWL